VLACTGRQQFHLRDSAVERAAGRHADIHIIQHSVGLGLQLTCRVAQGAIETRNIQKLRWLHPEQHCPLPEDATTIAAKAKNLEMLRFLQQSGCKSDEHTSYAAARTVNNIAVLQLLHESGCPLNEYVCNAAVAAGDLEQLKWLHARGASLDAVAPAEVCRGASLPVLPSLRAGAC
jgi:hypothetical protein